MKIIVATGAVKLIAPIATMIGPVWQQLNIAMGALMASARSYCNISMKIWHVSLLLPFTKRHCQQNLLHRILLQLATACQWARICAHVDMLTNMLCSERNED
jgi:hypothetical protein